MDKKNTNFNIQNIFSYMNHYYSISSRAFLYNKFLSICMHIHVHIIYISCIHKSVSVVLIKLNNLLAMNML